MKINTHLKHILGTTLLLTLSYLGGSGFARLAAEEPPISVTVSTSENSQPVSGSTSASWGLSFQEEGQAPVANASASYLKEFDAYYIEETDMDDIATIIKEEYERCS